MPILPNQTHREAAVKTVLGDDALLFKRID